ncbi:unnamed protein product [Brassicogethes aeneus]|uniref:CIDE-N domain-containing protein n=1 Tax=Brassicogethes aeneus TaxID=1431903 RepID=A0A9P0BEZ1_BRAAE|nr:unnamed protein product [Brassicogethes aeneus]
MGQIFKVWSCNRDKKCSLVLQQNENLVDDLILKASVKLKLNGSTVVLESDGTEINDNEVLVELKNETLVILQPGEQWWPIREDFTSVSNKSITSTDGSTITMTSDMNLDFQETLVKVVEDTTLTSPTTSEFICETNQVPTESNIIFVQVPQSDPISNNKENVITEYTWQLFDIPWSKIPQFMLTQCENGSGGKALRKEIIHIVVNDLRNIKTHIPNKAFREVARKMASKYPKLFLDTDEDGNVLGGGISTLVSQLQDRNWYLNRGSKRVGDYIKPCKIIKRIK